LQLQKKAEADAKKEGKEVPKTIEIDEDEAEEVVDLASLDVYDVEDVTNAEAGCPLYKEFSQDDWAMLTLRFELHLMAHAFRRDVDDPERAGIPLEHFAFYYERYFRKSLAAGNFGVESFAELVSLVRDTVFMNEKQVLRSMLPDEMESFQIFVKLTEDARRDRVMRIDLGDEKARLKISRQSKGGWSGNQGGAQNLASSGGQQKPWKRAWTN